MLRLWSFAPVMFVVVSALPLHADEPTYTIKFKELAKDETGSYEATETGELHVRVLVDGNVATNETLKSSEKLVFWEQILERSAGKPPTKVRRGYGAARLTLGDDKIVLPVEGKRVVIERKGNQFTHDIDGVTVVTPKMKRILDGEFATEPAMSSFLPDRPVKLKDSYRFNTKPALAALAKHVEGVDFDLKNVEALGRLSEVYEKDGRQFGKLLTHVEIPAKGLNYDGARINLKKGDKMVLQVSFDICIDGTAHVGTVKVVPYLSLTAVQDVSGQIVNMRMVYKGERNVTIKEMAKKK